MTKIQFALFFLVERIRLYGNPELACCWWTAMVGYVPIFGITEKDSLKH